MATNFEKWRKTLTPVDVLNDFGVYGLCGRVCPAQRHCLPTKHKLPSDGRKCSDVFYEWANKEAGDE